MFSFRKDMSTEWSAIDQLNPQRTRDIKWPGPLMSFPNSSKDTNTRHEFCSVLTHRTTGCEMLQSGSADIIRSIRLWRVNVSLHQHGDTSSITVCNFHIGFKMFKSMTQTNTRDRLMFCADKTHTTDPSDVHCCTLRPWIAGRRRSENNIWRLILTHTIGQLLTELLGYFNGTGTESLKGLKVKPNTKVLALKPLMIPEKSALWCVWTLT